MTNGNGAALTRTFVRARESFLEPRLRPWVTVVRMRQRSSARRQLSGVAQQLVPGAERRVLPQSEPASSKNARAMSATMVGLTRFDGHIC